MLHIYSRCTIKWIICQFVEPVMRINERFLVGPRPSRVSALLFFQLAFTILIRHCVVSLSISSNGNSKIVAPNGIPRGSQLGGSSLLTTQTPFMTTINQNIYPESQQQQHVPIKQQVSQDISISESRSSAEDHDESIPLATVNNHSRNNQQPSRPPQYVDVSALVGVS